MGAWTIWRQDREIQKTYEEQIEEMDKFIKQVEYKPN